MYLIKLQNENYFLVEGPTGYAFARSKARAKRFTSQEAAENFTKIVSGDITVVEC